MGPAVVSLSLVVAGAGVGVCGGRDIDGLEDGSGNSFPKYFFIRALLGTHRLPLSSATFFSSFPGAALVSGFGDAGKGLAIGRRLAISSSHFWR